MTYNTTEDKYWNPTDLDAELNRVYDICYGCQLCFNLCDSFPVLFDFVDERGDEVEEMTQDEKRKVVELCFQCKLCYPKCPYTPPHEWAIDFPRLMQRAKLVWNTEDPAKSQHKLLGNPEIIGKIGSKFSSLVNWANNNKLTRSLMEKSVGIHRDRNLPQYHGQTFEKWAKKRSFRTFSEEERNGRIALFFTCTVNYNHPDVGQAAVEVLERNKVEVTIPEQMCCGAPLLHGGGYHEAVEKVKVNLEHLHQAIQAGYDIIAPSPTCSMMLKEEYTLLVDHPHAQEVAEKTYDLCEYLMNLHREKKFDTNFGKGFGKVAYHFPCHLKNQNIGYTSRNLLRLLPDTEVELIDRCSGFDGVWGMHKDTYELSLKYGQKLFRGIEGAKPDVVVSDCPLSQLQIEKGVKKQAIHPILLIWEAYTTVSNR